MRSNTETVASFVYGIFYEHFSSLPKDDRERMATFKFREYCTRRNIDIPKIENLILPTTRVSIDVKKES